MLLIPYLLEVFLKMSKISANKGKQPISESPIYYMFKWSNNADL